jgi:SPP1 family predicted phage head-tail adaptor
MIRAGEFRHRVTIQAPVPTSDPRWGEGVEWQDVDTVWAKVVPTAAAEDDKDGGVKGAARFDVTLRFRPGVTSADRLVWGGRTLDVTGVVDVDARGRELRVTAVEHPQRGVAGG